MGKVIAGTTMSLDGFMNDRNGSVSRLYPDICGANGEMHVLPLTSNTIQMRQNGGNRS
jgi:hypothetical protein